MRFTTSTIVGLAALTPFGFARNDGSLKNGVVKDSGLEPYIIGNIQAGTESPGEWNQESRGASLDTGIFGKQEPEWDQSITSSNGDSARTSGITGNVGSSYSLHASIQAADEEAEFMHLGSQEEKRILQASIDCTNTCNNGRPVVSGISSSEFRTAIFDCLSVNGNCNYAGSFSCWDTSRVTDMSYAFTSQSSFNSPLECWDTSSVTNMQAMFLGSAFNQPIGVWDMSSVTYVGAMFYRTPFNQPIDDWDMSSVIDMGAMFADNVAFNQPIDDWDVSSVTLMSSMFSKGSFDHPIGNWDVSSVINMQQMFNEATAFNQPIDEWDVSSVINMLGMFNAATFNQPIDDWDVSSVAGMVNMFSFGSFDQPIGNWDVSSVTNMQQMFYAATAFNQPIDAWDVSRTKSMAAMFLGSAFNQRIDKWDVSSVTNASAMFKNAESFDQCLSTWASKTPSTVLVEDMFMLSGCPDTTDPEKSQGPWCQTSAESCFDPTDPSCGNKEGFKSKGKTITCDELENFSSKKKKKQCKKKKAKNACPGVCNPRCTCKDTATFKIKKNNSNDFKGKFKCENVGDNVKEPSCVTVVNKNGKLVKDYCVSKCDFCF